VECLCFCRGGLCIVLLVDDLISNPWDLIPNSRMTIRGLAKRSRNWRHRGRRRWSRASFGPYLASRRATSRPLSPLGVDPSSASNRGRGRFQGRLSTIFAGLKDTICSPKRAPFSEGISPGDVGVRFFLGAIEQLVRARVD
jgi:hypothetical protein